MSEPMCAPIDASRRPDASSARRAAPSSSRPIPNFEPPRAGGEMRMGVGGDARVDPDADPPLAGPQQGLERAERLGVDECAGGERGGEVGIGLADAVDDDPLRIGAGAQRERQLDRPDDLEAEALRGRAGAGARGRDWP